MLPSARRAQIRSGVFGITEGKGVSHSDRQPPILPFRCFDSWKGDLEAVLFGPSENGLS